MGGWCNFSFNNRFCLLLSSLASYFKRFIRPNLLYVVTELYWRTETNLRSSRPWRIKGESDRNEKREAYCINDWFKKDLTKESERKREEEEEERRKRDTRASTLGLITQVGDRHRKGKERKRECLEAYSTKRILWAATERKFSRLS
jgi:hypothetical protein